ncbi:secreted RxLR effector protein 161-like [Ischnura elegans]|uniref:secreted RxLR effector protein 161-like n=1 Tax=Ischnura elegans TaxID=197161 RepID=UPI001ED8B19B|nr:secreted RxLR effector protein 161-like [Ischnura elegans]
MEIDQSEDGITLSQRGYLGNLLKKFRMKDCNPLKVGMKWTTHDVTAAERSEKPFKEGIGNALCFGTLMHLAVGIPPDISHAVSLLSQFSDCYTDQHWGSAKRVLRYLHGTTNFCLSFRKSNQPLRAFVDDDWAGCSLDRRSFTGYAFLPGDAAISWESRKQRTVALPPTETEYMALSDAVKEAIYLRTYLKELGFNEIADLVIMCHNRGAIQLAENPVFHKRMKHIDL